MEEHDVWVIRGITHNTFKGAEVQYSATYLYCDRADEYYVPETLLLENDKAMKNAYKETIQRSFVGQ
jgi:hypothetical protein